MCPSFMNPSSRGATTISCNAQAPLCYFCHMTRSECLKRSVECCRLAEAASEPEMKVYLLRLALSWMQTAISADERVLEEA